MRFKNRRVGEKKLDLFPKFERRDDDVHGEFESLSLQSNHRAVGNNAILSVN